jgi:predicted ATPase/DNA-binding CsgD family transcriptional regulator
MEEQKNHSLEIRDLSRKLTSFIGRQEELVEVTDLLSDPECRLLTLTGPGGIGKTRLAIQATNNIIDDFSEGVFFIPLDALRSPDLIAPTITDKLGLPITSKEDPTDQLLDYLQNRTTLLVLDNFEHLMGGVGLVRLILEVTSNTKLFVTSREGMNLQHEWLYQLKGLPYPKSTQQDDYAQYAAVQLFSDRARRARRDFALSDEYPAVIRICQLVEGSPLALEIAASWINTLTCDVIANQIEQDLEFLTTSMHDIPERHRSVRVVFDQSWELLTEEQRDAYKRMAVFKGGFDTQAAQQVAGASMTILSSLVNKSLLEREPSGRYKIHEMLNQYTEQRLTESEDEAQEIHNLHSSYYTNFLQERFKGIYGSGHKKIGEEIEAELDNVRSAWWWAIEKERIDDIYRSTQTLAIYNTIRNRYHEIVNALEKAVQTIQRVKGAKNAQKTLAMLYVELAWLYIRVGELEKAEDILSQSQSYYEKLDIPYPPGQGTDPALGLGILASIQGDYNTAAQFGERARQNCSMSVHKTNLPYSLYILTEAAMARGDIIAAQTFAQQAYQTAEESDDLWFKAYCLNNLGDIARIQGQYTQAKIHYESSYANRREFNDPEGMALALTRLGEISICQNDIEEAWRCYNRSLVIYRQIRDRGGLGTAHAGLGRSACAMKKSQEAKEHLLKALNIAWELTFMPLLFSSLIGTSELLIYNGKHADAVEVLAMTVHHPACSSEAREGAKQLLSSCQRELRPDVYNQSYQRGADVNLDTLVSELRAVLLILNDDIVEYPISPEQTLIDPLTQREIEVLGLIADGLTNEQIAGRLVISIGTIKWYTSQIYRKLHVNSRTQAVARARTLELVN